jgi:nudix-type nucleoside diphosphatase (YffH/AdpP family)
VILVRQFRYPAYASLDPEQRRGPGARKAWLLEVVAGVLDEGRTVGEVAHKELLEEAGYKVKGDLQYVATVYPSPGGTSERMYLFLAEADARRRAGKGGGVAAEGEDVQVVVVPFQEALDMVADGRIVDAKTIILLQHLALLKAGKGTAPTV